MAKYTYGFQGIRLVLDHGDEATPAMVHAGSHSSTWDKATQSGYVGDEDQHELTRAQAEWLESPANQARVQEAFDKARAGNPEYQ